MNEQHKHKIKTLFWLSILWPAFLVAGVIIMMVFSQIDPSQLSFWAKTTSTHYSTQNIRMISYSIGFFLVWLVVSTSSYITLKLLNIDHFFQELNNRIKQQSK